MIETFVQVAAGLACLAFAAAVPGVPVLIVWLRRHADDDRALDLSDQLLSGYLFGLFLLSLLVTAALVLPFFPFSILIIALGLFVGAMTIAERYAAQRVVFVRALAAAAERGIPLAPLARAMARESGLIYRRRLRRFAQHLESGATLLDAAQAVPRLLPDAALVAVVTGTLSGNLALPLREVADAHAFERPVWRGVAMGAVYLFALLALAFLYMQGMVAFIFPKFHQIAEDFDMPVTTTWNWLPNAAHSTGVLVTSMLAFLLLAGLFFLSLLLSLGVVRWSFGPLARLRRRIDMALVMRSLAAMAEAHRPFGPLLEALATGFPSAWARPRLENAARQVAIGGDWCVALQSQGLLGASDAAALQAGERVGNLPWVMRELAASGERRFVYRVAALGQVLLPIAVIVCGLVVLSIVIVCFQPLVEMIGSLT
ncbi:MAG: type II secretion system F family protein [Pirellulales bacterium]|nr:type II secretion system F family protein [Pirellulales bacterium]